MTREQKFNFGAKIFMTIVVVLLLISTTCKAQEVKAYATYPAPDYSGALIELGFLKTKYVSFSFDVEGELPDKDTIEVIDSEGNPVEVKLVAMEPGIVVVTTDIPWKKRKTDSTYWVRIGEMGYKVRIYA